VTHKYDETPLKLVRETSLEVFVQTLLGRIDRKEARTDGMEQQSILLIDDNRDLRYLPAILPAHQCWLHGLSGSERGGKP